MGRVWCRVKLIVAVGVLAGCIVLLEVCRRWIDEETGRREEEMRGPVEAFLADLAARRRLVVE